MGRVPANVARFKRVEMALRACVKEQRRLIEVLEEAKAGKDRTSAELEGLAKMEVDARQCVEIVRASHHRLFEIAPPA